MKKCAERRSMKATDTVIPLDGVVNKSLRIQMQDILGQQAKVSFKA